MTRTVNHLQTGTRTKTKIAYWSMARRLASALAPELQKPQWIKGLQNHAAILVWEKRKERMRTIHRADAIRQIKLERELALLNLHQLRPRVANPYDVARVP